MAENTYELLYWQIPGLADITRLILEAVGASYTNKFVTRETFKEIKEEQRFGHIPKLTVKAPDGSVVHIWESKAIHNYLADIFDLLPEGAHTSAVKRAECFSNVFSLYEYMDRLSMIRVMPTLELRKEVRELAMSDKLPKALQYHEKLVAQSGGPYYYGKKMTLPDLILYALNVRFNIYIGEAVLINEAVTPHLHKLVQTLDAGRAGEYVRDRRDWG
ncbi:glutathione s-transferase variant 2 [Exidia glandulosa HHB12029]|uniref:Glutathione s-transferase variant 2 n=1 Tax=Exidia glandulosa HHB12029 TaxID=1314781 RepID=A0A165ER28_EXIGL|nr:glutathione s-transferase variant 2 [Exidia glandulosa HHB12029]